MIVKPIVRMAIKKAIPASSVMEHPALTVTVPIGAIMCGAIAAKNARLGHKTKAGLYGAFAGSFLATVVTVGIKGYNQGK